MVVEWFVLLCLLSVLRIHALVPRAADDPLDALSQDLFHFLSFSVQLDVQDKMKQGSVDVQSLADRISDLGVSFREMEEAKVEDLESQLTAIGTAFESECSTGCAFSEVIDGLGLIETITTNEAVIRASYAATHNPFSGGPVVLIENAVNEVNAYVPDTKWTEISKLIPEVVTAVKDIDSTELHNQPRVLFVRLQRYIWDLQTFELMLKDTLKSSKSIDEGVKSQIPFLKKIESTAALSDQLKSQHPKMAAFQQSTTTFSVKLDKIKTLMEQNQPEKVLTELKTLKKLNVGSKFLDYFDNSFTTSKWLTKLLTGNENQNLDKLKENLKGVEGIGERLGPLRTSVENVNSLKNHQALLDIAPHLQQTDSLFPDISQFTSDVPGCVKYLNLSEAFKADVSVTINKLVQPESHVKEFKDTLETFLPAQKSNFDNVGKLVDPTNPKLFEVLKSDAEVTALTGVLDEIKAGIPTINIAVVKPWLDSTNIGTIMTDAKNWLGNSSIKTALRCLKDNNVTDRMNGKVVGLQSIGKLAKGDASMVAAIQASNDLKTAIDIWKQLAAAPTRRRRAAAESTPIDELIVSTLSVRRLIRACSTGTLATLLQGVPQLDAKVKKIFEEALKSCQVLKNKAGSVQKVTHLSNLFSVLQPLGDTYIDTVKLADELAPSASDPAVQQAVQDLMQIDLNFARHDSQKVDEALDELEVHFAHLLGSGRQESTDDPDGCVGDDCEESSTPWGTIVGIVSVCVGSAIAGAITGVCTRRR